jgi:hypothetical protein
VYFGRGSGSRRDRLEISKETSIGRDGRFAFKCLVSHLVCQSSIRSRRSPQTHATDVLIITRVSSSARAARASRPPSG